MRVAFRPAERCPVVESHVSRSRPIRGVNPVHAGPGIRFCTTGLRHHCRTNPRPNGSGHPRRYRSRRQRTQRCHRRDGQRCGGRVSNGGAVGRPVSSGSHARRIRSRRSSNGGRGGPDRVGRRHVGALETDRGRGGHGEARSRKSHKKFRFRCRWSTARSRTTPEPSTSTG